jgi:hypothetical protein
VERVELKTGDSYSKNSVWFDLKRVAYEEHENDNASNRKSKYGEPYTLITVDDGTFTIIRSFHHEVKVTAIA